MLELGYVVKTVNMIMLFRTLVGMLEQIVRAFLRWAGLFRTLVGMLELTMTIDSTTITTKFRTLVGMLERFALGLGLGILKSFEPL